MMKNAKLLALMGLSLLVVAAIFAYINVDKTNVRYWYQDFVRKNEPYTLLLGSSSILRIPTNLLTDCKNPVVYGFNNGTTESIDSYLRYAKVEYATKIILYIGENDIARGENFETTFSQLKGIIQTFDANSGVEIGIVKLKYSPARAKFHDEFLLFNNSLEREFANTQDRKLIPFDEINTANSFIADGIHLNRAGNTQFSSLINDFCRR